MTMRAPLAVKQAVLHFALCVLFVPCVEGFDEGTLMVTLTAAEDCMLEDSRCLFLPDTWLPFDGSSCSHVGVASTSGLLSLPSTLQTAAWASVFLKAISCITHSELSQAHLRTG